MPYYTITNFLLSAFENGDQRMNKWLGKNIVNDLAYYYPYKYKVNAYSPITEFYIVLRLAEQYLIRAECRAQQDNIDGAKSDLNIIRSRAGLVNTTANNQDSMLLAISHERQVELFCEWGQRWCDLKRSGNANAILGDRKAPNWQPTDSVYPIPAYEIQNNPFLVQNAGY
jgi:hypothetical protein